MKKCAILIFTFFLLFQKNAIARPHAIEEHLSLEIGHSDDMNENLAEKISDSIPFPWSAVSLTDVLMKPYYVAPVPVKPSSAALPLVSGILGIGSLAFVIFQTEQTDEGCDFTAAFVVSPATCGLANGAISITTQPPSDYTYVWSNGDTTMALQNIVAGNYSVTISRVGTTCTQVVNAAVANDIPVIDATITTQDEDCGQTNGTATVSVNPAGFYTYLWSNGSTDQNQSGLAAGSYSVTVSAGGSCENSFPVQIGTVPFEPDITFSTTPAGCGLSDGAATTIIDPAGTYDITWSTGQTGSEATNLAAGVYTVTVTVPGSNCSASSEVTIDESQPLFTITLTSTSSGCGLSDGTATVVPDPAGEYTYAWSNGGTGAQLTGLVPGNYTVTVSIPGTVCSQEASVTVDELPPSFTITVTSTPSGCGLSDGTVTAVVDPAAEYTYAWSNGGSGAQLTGLVPGNYTVTVSIPGSTCSQEANVTVHELPSSFTITVTSTPSGCGLSDGTATVIVDPAGEYTYAWSNGGTGAQLTGLVPGNYTVTVSIPGSSCSQEANVTVDEMPPSFTITLTSSPSGCGMSDGTATAVVDPAGEYTYAWSNGGNGAQLTGLVPGDYTVTVSIPGSTCLQTASVTVDELPAAFSLSFTTTPAGCGITNGSATVIVDPAGTYTYLWSNGSTDPVLSNVGPGEYSVTVTIAGSMCTNSSSVMVEQAGGGFTATFTTDNADCGLANGTATITVDPAAEYTYAWSNQQTGPVLQLVVAGTYSVVVTDMNSCTEEFSVTIDQDPAEYISVDNTSPGNCEGGGDITFTLTTPGAGPLNVQVEGPQGAMPLSLSPGTYQLSSFIPVLPGTYTFTLYDEQIGNICIEVVSATVQDNTPPLIVADDFYTTPAGQALFENALDNDSGLNIEMTAIGDVFGGAVTFNASGDFTFIPEPGFNGDASFTYTVTDICGNTSTGIVTILVEQVNCDFDVTFQVTPASCGLADGMITAVVSPPGSYSFIWSTGDAGPTINNVASGPYSVTVTDNNLGCDLDFATSVPENPAEYISDIVITQPSCSDPGEIQFTATSNTPGELVMNVIHPNGLDIFFIDPGVVRLSDFISITPGDYTVEIIDPEAGTDCFDFFEATLNSVQMLQIVTEAVFPPSEPTAMDGSAIIVVIVPGVLPYTVLVNEVPYQTANSNTIQIDGLGVGEYLVQIIDATGCMSNELLVIIPFPDIILSFGTIVTNIPADQSNVEQSHVSSQVWRTGLMANLQYRLGASPQRIRMIYMPRVSRHIDRGNSYFEFTQLTKLFSLDSKKHTVMLEGGLGMRSGLSSVTGYKPAFALIQASAKMKIGNSILMHAGINVKGWSKIETPQWNVSFDF